MPFTVTEALLPSLAKSGKEFESHFFQYATEVSEPAHLMPRFVRYRVGDAYTFWVDDLKRVEFAERNLTNGLDHFKQCGHLAYWLRRSSPIVEFLDSSGAYATEVGHLDEYGEELRTLLYKYGAEYLAFDFGYQICLFYERNKAEATERAKSLVISGDYIEMVCNFLKCKNVSPHSLSLIYKSLFQ